MRSQYKLISVPKSQGGYFYISLSWSIRVSVVLSHNCFERKLRKPPSKTCLYIVSQSSSDSTDQTCSVISQDVICFMVTQAYYSSLQGLGHIQRDATGILWTLEDNKGHTHLSASVELHILIHKQLCWQGCRSSP